MCVLNALRRAPEIRDAAPDNRNRAPDIRIGAPDVREGAADGREGASDIREGAPDIRRVASGISGGALDARDGFAENSETMQKVLGMTGIARRRVPSYSTHQSDTDLDAA